MKNKTLSQMNKERKTKKKFTPGAYNKWLKLFRKNWEAKNKGKDKKRKNKKNKKSCKNVEVDPKTSIIKQIFTSKKQLWGVVPK